MSAMEPTGEWAVKLAKRESVFAPSIDPAYRKDITTPLYLTRSGFRHQYSAIRNAEVFATQTEARFGMEDSDTVVKVRVTIEEVSP